MRRATTGTMDISVICVMVQLLIIVTGKKIIVCLISLSLNLDLRFLEYENHR